MSDEERRLIISKIDHLRELTELKFSQVNKGIREMHDRQGKTNGNVVKNTEFRKALKVWGTAIVIFLGFFAPMVRDALEHILNNLFQ